METLSGVGVLDKVVALLSQLAVNPATLHQLETVTGVSRATAHRLLAALCTHGLVVRSDDGAYDLGHQISRWGQIAASRLPLVSIAAPVLAELGATTGESVQIFVAEGDRRRCLISLQSAHALQWVVPEGAVFELNAGSAGRVLSGQTGEWIASVAEREPGVASVSSPITGPDGAVIAAVCVSGPIDRLGTAPGERYGADVARAAAQISTGIGATLGPSAHTGDDD